MNWNQIKLRNLKHYQPYIQELSDTKRLTFLGQSLSPGLSGSVL